MYQQYEWNETTRKSEPAGFTTSNSIQVTVNSITKTGEIIDSAVDAGANKVSSVSFTVSDGIQEQVRNEALKEAAVNAKSKASSIAEGLGVSLGSVYSASENSYLYVPYYRDSYAGMAVSADAVKETTPVTPGDIEFTATVSVQFEII